MPDTVPGHWRKLEPHQQGEGPYGKPISGRTWVDRIEKPKKIPAIDFTKMPEGQDLEAAGKLSRAEEDLKAWKKWKESGSIDDLEALMDRFQGMVNNEVRKWSSAPVPKSAISGAANRQLVKAFHAYDPDKGAMNTFIHYYLRKTSAVVYKYQNLGRIPSHRIRKISDFKNARDFLEETLDRPPSAVEIAEELSWSLSEVSRMESELRRDLIASKNFETDSMAELAHEASEEKSALRSVYYELDTVERLVFEYTLGVHGKPEISAGDIARKLHISAPKVSRIRSKIDTKLRERGI